MMRSSIVGSVLAVLLAGLVAKSLLQSDEDAVYELLVDANDAGNDIGAVIVAGAWRLPNGSLSRAFTQRVLSGARFALLLDAKVLLLTGGHNESLLAEKYLRELSLTGQENALFPQSVVSSLPEKAARRAAKLNERLRSFVTFGDFVDYQTRSETGTALPGGFKIVTENVSTTTYENALHAARTLKNMSFSSIDRVLVVSSPYHMLRCKVLFSRMTPEVTREVLVVPTMEKYETELIVPEEWWVSMTTVPPTFRESRVVPRPLALAAHSIHRTYANWRAHLRISALSLFPVSLARECVAFAVNGLRGHLFLWPLDVAVESVASADL